MSDGTFGADLSGVIGTETTDWTCAVCATVSEQRFVVERGALPPGPPDLDARAFNDKLEDTNLYDVWRCPACGYAKGPVIHLQEPPRASDSVATLVHSAGYRFQLSDPELPELANSYLCRAMVEAAEGSLATAGWTALLAAWVCDDKRQEEGAQRCRLRAVELWSDAEEAGQQIVEQGFPATQLLFADALRRAGRFDDARSRCHRGLSGRPKEPFRSLLEFELELITSEDTAAHSVSEVVGPW